MHIHCTCMYVSGAGSLLSGTPPWAIRSIWEGIMLVVFYKAVSDSIPREAGSGRPPRLKSMNMIHSHRDRTAHDAVNMLSRRYGKWLNTVHRLNLIHRYIYVCVIGKMNWKKKFNLELWLKSLFNLQLKKFLKYDINCQNRLEHNPQSHFMAVLT